MNSFSQKISIIIGNPYVRPPDKVLNSIFKQAGKSKGPIPVRGTINGAEFIQTLVKYQGDWRLYVNMIMLKAAGIKFPPSNISSVVGTKVKIEVEFDPSSREFPLNPKLGKALEKSKKAKQAYEALAPYRKKEINRYLGFMKSKESVDKNVGKIILHLLGKETDTLYPLMHRKKA